MFHTWIKLLTLRYENRIWIIGWVMRINYLLINMSKTLNPIWFAEGRKYIIEHQVSYNVLLIFPNYLLFLLRVMNHSLSSDTSLICRRKCDWLCWHLHSPLKMWCGHGRRKVHDYFLLLHCKSSIWFTEKHIFKIIIYFLIQQNMPQIMSFHLRYRISLNNVLPWIMSPLFHKIGGTLST